MPEIVIIDTSIFSNVLNVPDYNGDHATTITLFEEFIYADASFLLPLAAVFETGNHIGRIADGTRRRHYAEAFRDRVTEALQGRAYWFPTRYPDNERLVEWLREFPDSAMTGMGLADFSIKKEWDATRALNPGRRVRIWSLDKHLKGYDTGPRRPTRRA